MDIRCKSKLLENPDAVPVEVDFVPLQTVPSRDRVGMMIVVPALPESQQCHPPTVG
jgi:hypothetical protein